VTFSYDLARVCSTLDFLRATDAMPAKEFEKLAKQLSGGWTVWEDAQRQSTITKASIQPLVKTHGHTTKNEIQSYEDKVTAYAKAVDKLPIWKYETGYKKAMEGIDEAVKRHKEESRETDRMSHLAMMFEFPTYMDNSRAKMKLVKEELESVKAMWAVVKEVQDAFHGFNKVCCRRVHARVVSFSLSHADIHRHTRHTHVLAHCTLSHTVDFACRVFTGACVCAPRRSDAVPRGGR
jgi:hypothetical protein